MRTNIVIDDALISEALSLTGIKTKREVVDEALRVLVEQKKRANAIEGLKALRGKITFWDDVLEDLDEHRIHSSDHEPTPARVLGEEKAAYTVKLTEDQLSGEQASTESISVDDGDATREKQ